MHNTLSSLHVPWPAYGCIKGVAMSQERQDPPERLGTAHHTIFTCLPSQVDWGPEIGSNHLGKKCALQPLVFNQISSQLLFQSRLAKDTQHICSCYSQRQLCIRPPAGGCIRSCPVLPALGRDTQEPSTKAAAAMQSASCSWSVGSKQGQTVAQLYYCSSCVKRPRTCVLLPQGCGSCGAHREHAACLHMWSLEGGLGWRGAPCSCAWFPEHPLHHHNEPILRSIASHDTSNCTSDYTITCTSPPQYFCSRQSTGDQATPHSRKVTRQLRQRQEKLLAFMNCLARSQMRIPSCLLT